MVPGAPLPRQMSAEFGPWRDEIEAGLSASGRNGARQSAVEIALSVPQKQVYDCPLPCAVRWSAIR
jgi:hypothetical protein